MGSELNSTPQLSLGFTILPPKIKFFGDLDNQKLYKLQGTVELSPFLLDLFLSLPSLTVLELLLGWAPNILPRSFFLHPLLQVDGPKPLFHGQKPLWAYFKASSTDW